MQAYLQIFPFHTKRITDGIFKEIINYGNYLQNIAGIFKNISISYGIFPLRMKGITDYEGEIKIQFPKNKKGYFLQCLLLTFSY